MFTAPQINLYTADVPQLQAFYERLGFVESFRYAPEGVPRHVELKLGDFVVGIADASAAAADHGLSPNPEAGSVELVLWCDDADGEFARLVAAGAPAVSAPHDWLGQLRLAWVADPDGNPIQLAQRRPEGR